MAYQEVTLTEVLEFREEKQSMQRSIQGTYPKEIVICLGMNIPGPVKTSSFIFNAFCEGRKALRKAVLEAGGEIKEERILKKNAGYAAGYAIKGIERNSLKKTTVLLEETHPLGRLFDVDVLNENLEPVSRTELEMPGRKCLICNRNAKVCGRSRAHSVQELQEKIKNIIEEWEKKSDL